LELRRGAETRAQRGALSRMGGGDLVQTQGKAQAQAARVAEMAPAWLSLSEGPSLARDFDQRGAEDAAVQGVSLSQLLGDGPRLQAGTRLDAHNRFVVLRVERFSHGLDRFEAMPGQRVVELLMDQQHALANRLAVVSFGVLER